MARWGFTPQKPMKRAHAQPWLSSHTGEHEVFYLPSYSPGLNLGAVFMFNADLKAKQAAGANQGSCQESCRKSFAGLPEIATA
ncbi:hypothetical protein MB84_30370 (plasmid) [Pandoraea oxalativorans]|uniref:Tc1-like transposase DDE domain-containing protein n=1 Tax=Pandoraea oxalativorans TaxID=573737 RepID=A0A0G3ICV4_9BURK|nr:hypothetical protein MB84_30370 [Pandoraea oxalativorans]